MPLYTYYCTDCEKALSKQLGRKLDDDEFKKIVFLTQHGMNPTPVDLKKATECPFCDGHDTIRHYIADDVSIHSRGVNWDEYYNKNKAAIKRDLDIHTLENSDPYAEHRTDSDKDQTMDRLLKERRKITKQQVFDVNPAKSTT